jgi:D-glycero-D-manno-heptose 1,7-bisphosphate phosphatase
LALDGLASSFETGRNEVGIPSLAGPLGQAVFLDRAGLLNRSIVRDGKPYAPDALDAVATLRKRGFWLCVVTNQPDVARGTQRRESMPLPQARPGLLLTAAAEHNIPLDTSYRIGDSWRDIDCGHAAKCTTILVDRGYQEPLRLQPHFRVPDLVAATRVICS